jgi:hypothetical protein
LCPTSKGDPIWNQRDVYIDYPFEDVMYRWDHKAKKACVKFYGKPEHKEPVPQDNRLLNEATSNGDEISQHQYEAK